MRFIGTKRAMAGAVVGALLAVVALAGCGSDDDSTDAAATTGASGAADTGKFAKASGTLIFGTVPDQAGSDSNWKPLEEYIAKQTGLKVEYFPTADYTALIAAAVAGKVDVAAFSGLTYVNAINKGAKQAVASAVIASAGLTDPGYYSEAIVPKGSDITSVAGFKGKTVCFVSKSSTSGFLFPMLALQKAGLNISPSGTDPSGNPTFADFKASFAGAHDKSVQAVASKQCDAGFAEDSEVEPGVKDGSLVSLDKQYVPGGPLTYSTTLPQDVQTKLKSVLGSVTLDQITAAGISVTDGFKDAFQGAKPEDETYYDAIRDICSKVAAADCAK